MRTAVAARDQSYDGRFVFAVITTGVFCRPSCAARPARAENLRFFATPEDALKSGFRPCKRCKPDDPHRDVQRMIELGRYLEAHADQKFTLADLAERQNLSPTYLQKAFKSVFGVSPKAYQDAVRLKTLKGLLKGGDDVTGAIYEAGYGSASRGYEKAVRNIGMTPGTYRDGGVGEQIVFACRETSFGPLMMAATARGVCFAMFGESEAALTNQLAAEFPKATLELSKSVDSIPLDQWIDALDAHLSRETPRPEIPIDLRGTAFQVKVWQFLLSIPEGDVCSYSDVASGIDRPAAVRAAASACGQNRIAVLVPCHRVLRSDGGIGGYRWGLDRKRALLDLERSRDASA
ncbi:bifunctional transcriptional activator/DNA repair enzyme AdaA [Rhodothalassium salexigens]|uniref:bifunctional transcriptional activator/DNA repair enzyme AdaA n=1 Tax=Rhodothalassium salexigens TaxID=1086 RepID=UPI001911C926|nr:methylated-DNA--[protein]-cysteine S-methyltransferase [Rhodothalassium salexigens]MBK5919727.1 cysteine methyltransferase [Rhodothalassium salexigens]